MMRCDVVSRRAALVSGAAALLSGCGDGAMTRALRTAYDIAFGDEPANQMTRAQIDAFPYALIEARVGKSVFAVLVLEARVGPDLLWISSDRRYLHTRSWRLVKTAALPTDIASTMFPSEDPLAVGLHRISNAATASRIVDFSDPTRHARVVRSRFEDLGPAPVTIVGRTYRTRLMREVNNVELEDWEYENRYWFDPANGMVWRSIQHVDSSFPPLRISVLMPPAADI